MKEDKFQALGPPIRREILRIIAGKGMASAAEIVSRCQVSGAAVSQHLKVLREAGLVTVEKKAQQRIYRLHAAGIEEASSWLGQLAQLWDERFERLDALLEAEKRKAKGR